MRKVVFYFMFLVPILSFGQSKSIEQLGKELTEALSLNDPAHFKSLIIPRDSLLAFFSNDTSTTLAQKQLQMEFMNQQYDSQFVAMFMLNYKVLQRKIELFNIDFDDIILEEFFVTTPEQKPLHVVHGSITNSTFHHLYFYPIQYNEYYYLVNPLVEVRDSELEF